MQAIYPFASELPQFHKQDDSNAVLLRFRSRLNEVINGKSALLICPYESNYSVTPLRRVTHQDTRRYSLI